MSEARRLQYKYAEIDLETGECFHVFTTTEEQTDPEFIPIATLNYDYMGKYYLNGAWYEDAAGTIPWSPAE